MAEIGQSVAADPAAATAPVRKPGGIEQHKDTVTRIVRGPGRFMGRKPGERVEVPVGWIDTDPTVEKCSMSLAEHAAREAAAKVSPPAAKDASKGGPGGLRAVVATMLDAAREQLDAAKARAQARAAAEAEE